MESVIQLLKIDPEDGRLEVLKIFKELTRIVGSDLRELQDLLEAVWKALESSKSEEDLNNLVSLVKEIQIPISKFCDEVYLSSPCDELNDNYEGKRRELHNKIKEEIHTQLAKVYSLRALFTQETDPNSENLMDDIKDAIRFWCLEETCTLDDLGLFFSVYHLLALKGNTYFHSQIYDKMLRSSEGDLKKLCTILWISRTISHDICGSPVCGDFLNRLSAHDESWSRLYHWTENMDEIHAVGLKNKLAIETNIQQMKKLANDLIQNDASDHNQFVLGHMYYDLAETMIRNGSIIEAQFFSKEAYELRFKLLKKMFIFPEDNRTFRFTETLKVSREVEREVPPHDEGLNHFGNIYTPWNILNSFLQSCLQCGHVEDNVHRASDYLHCGKNIALVHNLEIYKIRFSDALANHHTRNQSEDDSTKELTFAVEELKVTDKLISCWKCKKILEASTGVKKGASFTNEGVKILKDKQWENSFSNGTFCHSCGISGLDSQSDDEICWHCQSEKILESGSLENAIYFKVEIIRRHMLMRLLASLGEYYRGQKDYEQERHVLFERLSLYLSRSTFCNKGINVSEKFIENIIDKRLTKFPFPADYAALAYDVCCHFLRNTSEVISKTKMVCGMQIAFTHSRQIPILNQKISRLLSVLLYEDMMRTGGEGLLHVRNGLDHHRCIAFFHQASIGALFNNTLWSRMKKKAGLDLRKDDYTEEDLDKSMTIFFSELPSVPIVCMSLLDEDENLLTNLLSPTHVWLQLSRLCQNKEPKVYIVPIDLFITVVPSLEIEINKYPLPITQGDNVLDKVAPLYNSLMKQREIISSGGVIKNADNPWERTLDEYLREVLSEMENWFSSQKDTILGDLIDGAKGHRTPVILILDLEIQFVAWESMPFLRSEEIYRMPSILSVSSTLERSKCFIKKDGRLPEVDLSNTFFVLNPNKDLEDTQNKLKPTFDSHQFQGVVKEYPSQEKLNEVLDEYDMFIFDGHGSGLTELSTDKIGDLDRCSAALLTACSSGALELHGCYKPTGPALDYIFAGSPVVGSYLWVTNANESDTMTNHILKILTGKEAIKRTMGKAIALARDQCSLPHYEGAGMICSGVPTKFIKSGILPKRKKKKKEQAFESRDCYWLMSFVTIQEETITSLQFSLVSEHIQEIVNKV